jgi:D-alanine-D-alanine ligase-like ATP-grasp enzyme
MKIPVFILGLVCGVAGITVGLIGLVFGQPSLVNISELDTLDRMRYTAIQMTLMTLDINNESLTNMSDNEIASIIYDYQQKNDSIDRLTTLEVEDLYRNITEELQQE